TAGTSGRYRVLRPIRCWPHSPSRAGGLAATSIPLWPRPYWPGPAIRSLGKSGHCFGPEGRKHRLQDVAHHIAWPALPGEIVRGDHRAGIDLQDPRVGSGVAVVGGAIQQYIETTHPQTRNLPDGVLDVGDLVLPKVVAGIEGITTGAHISRTT